MADIYVGDYGPGRPHEITVKKEDGTARDLSGATALQLTYKKPGGSTLVVTPVFKTDGTDGVIKYTFLTGEIDKAGSWPYQLLYTDALGALHSSIGSLEVGANI